MNTRRLSDIGVSIFLYAILILLSAFMVLPFIWMLSTSLKSAEQIFAFPPVFIPSPLTLENYVYIQQEYDIVRILFNTVFLATTVTIATLFFSSLAGYGFAKFNYPGKGGLFGFLLATLIIPAAITMVPLYLIMRDLGWLNTYLPLIVPGMASAFGIFFMRQYISTISDDLMDAARIDGAGEFSIYLRVILPIVTPGLTSLGLIIFMSTWNSFIGPLIYLRSPELFTLTLVISNMTGPVGFTAYGAQMATSVISLLPLLVLFLVLQRRYFEGITAGAVKG